MMWTKRFEDSPTVFLCQRWIRGGVGNAKGRSSWEARPSCLGFGISAGRRMSAGLNPDGCGLVERQVHRVPLHLHGVFAILDLKQGDVGPGGQPGVQELFAQRFIGCDADNLPLDPLRRKGQGERQGGRRFPEGKRARSSALLPRCRSPKTKAKRRR